MMNQEEARTEREHLEAELKIYKERLENNKKGAPIRRKLTNMIDELNAELRRLSHYAA